MGDVHEQRVGRLRVRGCKEGYREAALPVELEIARDPLDASKRSRLAPLLAGVLVVALLSFAVLARSGPSIGSVTVVMVAFAWLFYSQGRGRARVETVLRVADGELRARGEDGSPLRVRLDRIEALGLGLDEAPLRTLWIRVEGEGRMLLLDGLSEEEASVASRMLSEVIEHRGEEPRLGA
jgi:hypothetical protein